MTRWAPGFDHGQRPQPDSLIFAFAGARLLLAGGEGPSRVPTAAEVGAAVAKASRPVYLGRLGAAACFAVALDFEPEPPGGLHLRGLRELFGILPEELMAVAGRASQTVEWYLAHAFCGRCGSPTELSETELARLCPSCGALHYPRITPAVIMLVERGEEMLLASNANFRGGFYSCLAGFVEAGETLEQAVAREVREEVGLEVSDITYFGSQAWPFPSQLMVGFTARYAAGEIVVQQAEIIEARWFGREDLPPLPGPFSIARRLIDSFLQR